MAHPYLDPAQAAAFNELSIARDSTFEISYFGLHGFGGISRLILAVGGANFKNHVPTDWASEKPQAPFGVLPLLKESSKDGTKVLHVAETDAIERYLSRKFGFNGENAFEKNLVSVYSSNSTSLYMQIFRKLFGVKDEQQKAEAKETLVAGPFMDWVKFHEKYLAANGSNGHYVGNKTTLADIKTYYVVGMLQSLTGEDLVSESKTPAIWKVKTALEDIPSASAWFKSEDYKTFSEENKRLSGF
ncbi:hypothetical protein BC939DRAFT_450597 [Gamsiella multidivaricata]|uniref:uncharacterized protein n=1 Tax=Gamsiella multidivaricata TaxID=101098 RepID=UPI002220C5C9|nr:uncharacterized protein BC939DRAFT_450597 [Gamsiella multidivaricata]KAG0369299.1 hypothetical protein BGZ54_010325 [Gamsiella multidivaricata]KAI7824109.1 hypothetical protein BC939DRAFT_450597 [Gamsiella multidivaricata]